MSTETDPTTADNTEETVGRADEQQTESRNDEQQASVARMLDEIKRLNTEALEALKVRQKAEAEAASQKKGEVDLESELAAARAERDEARRDAETALRQSILIHKGLKSPRFSRQILSEYDGQEDFESFVDKCKQDTDLTILFNSEEKAKDRETVSKGNLAGPSGGSPGSQQGGTRTAEAAYRQFAEERYPSNKSLQDSYVRNRMSQDKRGS